MSTKVKITIAVILVLIIGAVCTYFFWWKPKKEKEAQDKLIIPGGTPKITPPKTTPTINTSTAVIKPNLVENLGTQVEFVQ